MDAELKATIRRELRETWRTMRLCAAVMFLAYVVADGIRLLAGA